MGKSNLRRLPRQARSRETFERILTASAELLEEVGFGAFTTNLLAERTGISVRAIYRYFPNKHALIMELAIRLATEWQHKLAEVNPVELNARNWSEIWPAYLDQFVLAVRDSRGGIAIIQAMRSDPQLRIFDDDINEEYIRGISASLKSSTRTLNSNDADALARVLMKSTVAVVDSILEAPPTQAKKMLGMLKSMHISLINELINEP